MKHIDEFFKSRLDGEGIPYRETYWNDMDALIAGVHKKKKKQLFTAIIVSLALAFTTSAGIYLYDRSTKTKQSSNNRSGYAETNTIQTENHVSDAIPNLTKSSESPSRVLHSNRLIPSTSSKTTAPDLSHQFNNTTPIGTTIDNYQYEQMSAKENEQTSAILPSITKNNMADWIDPNAQYLQIQLHIARKHIAIELPEIPILKTKPIVTKLFDTSIHQKWNHAVGFNLQYHTYSKRNIHLYKASEQTSPAFTGNIQFKAFKGHYGFITGIDFMHLREKTNYSNIQTTYQFDTSYRMLNPNYAKTIAGSRIALLGTHIDTTAESQSYISCPDCISKRRYIAIPASVAYRHTGKYFTLLLNAGLSMAFITHKSGLHAEQLNGQFKSVELRTSQDITPVMLFGLSGLTIEYKVTSHLSVQAGVTQLTGFNSMYRSYEQKANVRQFSFGLAYRIKSNT